MVIESWNKYPRVSHRRVVSLSARQDSLPEIGGSLLVFGNGRSYSDVCLNDGGDLLLSQGLDRFISFDRQSGELRCESGVLLKDILELIVPQGWFLPVTPGTRFATVGGAIANDVHGKNHHRNGTFGHHVRSLELLRSDGQRMVCSQTENAEMFLATVGGLGLTGLICWAELKLIPIGNAYMLTESRRFRSLDEFWEINLSSEKTWPYTVAWIDCLSGAKGGLRGVFFAGAHAPAQKALPVFREKRRSVPFTPPISLINQLSLRAFNAAYFRQRLSCGPVLSHYVPYFYPLDGVLNWNRIYGKKGFFQYQCVLPPEASKAALTELMKRIANSGQGSFLAVLKTFGQRESLGMLSFPRPGATLALDFPNLGEKTHRLFSELDAVVAEAGGALYPAKDARMPAAMFRAGFPRWEAFTNYIDPRFSSGFWRRVAT